MTLAIVYVVTVCGWVNKNATTTIQMMVTVVVHFALLNLHTIAKERLATQVTVPYVLLDVSTVHLVSIVLFVTICMF